jgi:hypothetical protein
MALNVVSAQDQQDRDIALTFAAIQGGYPLDLALIGLYARAYKHALEHAGYVQQAIREETQDS